LKSIHTMLTRRNLRDIIIISSILSVPFFSVNDTTLFVAFFLLGLGCCIHIVSKGTLIRNTVLCKEGIYGLIRHPYYLANHLIDWSFCVLSGNLLLILLYPFLFHWAYGSTMRREEQFLFSQYGNTFTKTSMTIPQIYPDLTSIKNIRALFKGFCVKRITTKEYSRVMRFCATGLLLAFIHKIKIDFPLGLRALFPIQNGFDEFMLAFFLLVFYSGSVILSFRKAKLNGNYTIE
jgi:hypothetical protein